MQSLKEFSIYTKRVFNGKDPIALRENAIALGIDEKVMVENAGYAVASQLRRSHKEKRALFVCGSGGKGAIGLSAARHLLNYAEITVAFLGDPEHIHNDSTRFNYGMLSDMMQVHAIGQDGANGIAHLAKGADYIVDAIIGVGLKGRLTGFLAGVVRAINESKKEVISIDLPTGLDPDTGMQNSAGIKASQLLALHKLKVGVEKSRGIGNIMVLDVGVPLSAELFTGPGDLIVATEPRLLTSNKYTHGNVLIVGGGGEYKGAPLLAAFATQNALAALRTGSGYVTIAAPRKILDIASRISPLLVTKEIKGGAALAGDIPALLTVKHDVMVIGPGLAKSDEVYKAVSEVCRVEKEHKNVMVVDATAIHALRRYKNAINPSMIITPHDGEFKALTGINLKNCTLEERAKKAINFAKNYSCTLVLKGHETIVTNGDLLKINMAHTPALATMGTGDVLSGIIGSYASFHKDIFESAVAGVYVHSRIADNLYKQKGDHVIAQDVVDAIPETLRIFDIIK